MSKKNVLRFDAIGNAESFIPSRAPATNHNKNKNNNTVVAAPQQPPGVAPSFGSAQSPANPNYMPTEKDILCGRGRGNFMNEGNRVFLSFLKHNAERYINASRRAEKKVVIGSIVSALHDEDYRFLKRDETTTRWYVLNETEAYDRAAYAIRDLLRQPRTKKAKAVAAAEASMVQSAAFEEESNDPLDPLRVIPAHSSASKPHSFPIERSESPTSAMTEGVQTDEHRSKLKPLDRTISSLQSQMHETPGRVENKNKPTSAFEIFFQLDATDFGQILTEVEDEKDDKKSASKNL